MGASQYEKEQALEAQTENKEGVHVPSDAGPQALRELLGAASQDFARDRAAMDGAEAARLNEEAAAARGGGTGAAAVLRSEVNSELNFPPNFEGLVLGCIDADFCK